jgi:DNA repair exonuclease SbcCD nuclease subunit
MSRVLVAADLHISDRVVMGRPRLPVYMDMLQQMWDIASREKVDAIVFAGDVIDNKNKPPMEVLLSIQDALWHAPVEVHWLRGNHESPSKETPERSIISLFDRDSLLCKVHPIVTWSPGLTHIHKEGERPILFLPWYPPEEYKKHAAFLTTLAKGWKKEIGKKPILITHVGLKEGSTSPSNFHPPSSVSVSDLSPEDWAVIICGDYHAHQFVAKNVFYTGAPIPHNFGDFNIKGVWIVDSEKLEIKAVPLVGLPTFVQWNMVEQPDKPHWTDEDYVRIYARPGDVEVIQARYPDADVRVRIPEDQVVLPTDSRMSLDASGSRDVLLTRYLEYKGVDEKESMSLKEIGLEILEGL